MSVDSDRTDLLSEELTDTQTPGSFKFNAFVPKSKDILSFAGVKAGDDALFVMGLGSDQS